MLLGAQPLKKNLLALLALGVAAVVVAVSLGCGDGDSNPNEATPGQAGQRASLPPPTLEDPDAQNPDRDAHVDLSKEPFHPEWVGGTLVVAYVNPPGNLNNLLWHLESTRSYIAHYLVPFLLEASADATPEGIVARPCAAAAMPRRHEDDRTYTWTLRRDLTWEDGVPVTAHDYAFTWQLIQNPEIDCERWRSALAGLESVEAKDDWTLEVRFDQPIYSAVTAFGLDFPVVPSHAVPGDDPQAFNATHQHIGFGPYRIVENTEQRLLLTLRDEYRTKPFPLWPCYVESIEFRFIKDDANRNKQVRQGRADIAAIPAGSFAGLGEDPTFVEHNWRTVYTLPVYDFVAWNTVDPSNPDRPHPLFGTAAVRRAMAHLVDRDRIIQQIKGGFAKKVNGPFWHRDADYDASVEIIPFDPARARALLQEEGWALNAKNLMEKDGREFRFELLVIDSPLWTLPMEVFKQDALEAGVAVEIRNLPWPAFRDLAFSHAFDAFFVMNGLRPPVEPDLYGHFHSSLARTPGQNWAALSDPTVDELLEAIRTTLDPAPRRELRKRFHRVLDGVQPFTILWSNYSCVAVNRRWANVKVHDLGIWFRDLVLRDLMKK
jgi:peptide/nickel transport system substrate-binding protein